MLTLSAASAYTLTVSSSGSLDLQGNTLSVIQNGALNLNGETLIALVSGDALIHTGSYAATYIPFYGTGGGITTDASLNYSGGVLNAPDLIVSRISTGSGYWDLGTYTAGAPAATGYVTVTIGGVAHKLLAV